MVRASGQGGRGFRRGPGRERGADPDRPRLAHAWHLRGQRDAGAPRRTAHSRRAGVDGRGTPGHRTPTSSPDWPEPPCWASPPCESAHPWRKPPGHREGQADLPARARRTCLLSPPEDADLAGAWSSAWSPPRTDGPRSRVTQLRRPVVRWDGWELRSNGGGVGHDPAGRGLCRRRECGVPAAPADGVAHVRGCAARRGSRAGGVWPAVYHLRSGRRRPQPLSSQTVFTRNGRTCHAGIIRAVGPSGCAGRHGGGLQRVEVPAWVGEQRLMANGHRPGARSEECFVDRVRLAGVPGHRLPHSSGAG